jgi:hypothetical protein
MSKAELNAWLKAVEDYYANKPVDPLIVKILRAIVLWHSEGKSPGWIVRELTSGATLWKVDIDKTTVKAIIKHNEALGPGGQA